MSFGIGQSLLRGKVNVALSTGAYTGTMSSGREKTYVDGGVYMIYPTSSSTDAATLNINGIGAKPIYKSGLVKININDLISGRWYAAVYNNSLNGFEIDLPKVIVADYNFGVNGGAQGTINLTATIPVGIILKTAVAHIECGTTLASSGNSLIKWGLGSGNEDWIDTIRPYTNFAYAGSNNAHTLTRFTAFGSLDLTGGSSGTIDTVKVSGYDILGGAVTYSSSLSVTAALVAKKINSNPLSVIHAENSGATVYLYQTNNAKYRYTALTMAVTATSTTLTTGNYNDMSGGGFWDAVRITSSAKPISIDISGADLTGGQVRLWIPYEIK